MFAFYDESPGSEYIYRPYPPAIERKKKPHSLPAIQND